MSSKQTPKRLNELGFASLVVGLILVVVMALLTVSFAQLTRREQVSALDKQLATQAYYAAESGINDVYQDIQNGIEHTTPAITSVTPGVDGNTCLGTPLTDPVGSPPVAGNILNQADGVSYTCALVDLRPPALSYSNVPTNGSKSTQFTVYDPTGQNIVSPTSITVSWKCASGDCTNFPAYSSTAAFPTNTAWGSTPGVLEFSLTPLSSFTRNSLLANDYTAYLYPSTGAGGNATYSNNPVNSGSILSGNCSAATDSCSVTISLPGGPTGPTSYLLRLQSIYAASNVSVTLGGGDRFSGGQATIDVTGKAQDVLKRIRVTVPLQETTTFPGKTISAGAAICKDFEVYQTGTDTNSPDGVCDDPNIPPTGTPGNPDGNALIGASTCPTSGCPPVQGDSYHFVSAFVNHSVNSSPTLSCTWTVDNITLGTQISSQTYPGSALPCQTYPNIAGSQIGLIQVDISGTTEAQDLQMQYPAPLLCTTYQSKKITIKATLTLNLANGTTPTNTTYAYLPRCY